MQASSDTAMDRTGAGTPLELVMFESGISDIQQSNGSTASDVQEIIVCGQDANTLPTFHVHNGSHVSLTSLAVDVCRICHCEAEPGSAPLISPCACSGTLRYVHQSCLQQWIKSANTKSCELCKLNFQMTTTVKPFRKWQKLEMTKLERHKIFCSVTFHVIAITCVVWSLYVLIDRTTEEIHAGVLEWPFWTKLIVVAIGFTGGLVFMYVQCKMYVQLCRRWRAYNRVIHVQDCSSHPPHRATGGSGRKAANTEGTHADVPTKSERLSRVTQFESTELQLL